MKKVELALPELWLIAATRGMLGAGVGLLLAGKLDGDHRKTVGLTLLLIGAVSTVPLAMSVLGKSR